MLTSEDTDEKLGGGWIFDDVKGMMLQQGEVDERGAVFFCIEVQN